MASIGAAEGTQIKRLAKGKAVNFDPKQAKKLVIHVAQTWPAWQAKYIDLVRETFDGMSLDMKEMGKKMEKAEMKKAMPFVQTLKRRLESGEPKDAVFERDLGFDEVSVLREMVPGLKATVPRLKEVDIVVVDEGAKDGGKMLGDGKERVEQLSHFAAAAEPGSPSFEFANL